MKKKYIYAIIAVLLILAAYFLYPIYKKYSVVEAEIEKAQAYKGDIEVTFQDIGDISPKNVIEIRSLASGELKEVLVREGDFVKKGQKLAVVLPGQSAADKFMPVEVLSPIDGTVLKCEGQGYYDEPEIKKPGERVTGASDYNPTCIMKVADLKEMIVKLEVGESEVMKLRKGMPVSIFAEAAKKNFKGRVSVVSPNAKKERNGGVKTFPVEIEILGNPNVLPGMTARVSAVLETKKNVLLIPISGVFESKGRNFVYLYNDKTRKAIKTFVTLGIRNEMEAEVLSGLKEGDSVYTDKPLNIENDKVS
ncbi:MAG: HlyD family efflux transporter periplasmic adaptor subunit [Elusimicrobiota bacterium]